MNAPSRRPRRVGLLAPMTHELAPLVDLLALEPRSNDDDALHDAVVDGIEFVATMTGIGMAAATAATQRLLDDGAVEHVIVVGIAGGIHPDLQIGALVVPTAVLHGETGRMHVPTPLGDAQPHGLIRSSDEFLEDEVVLARLVADGVVALDMETAAVAVVCEDRGLPWSVFRSISDRPADKLVDGAIWEMTLPDGGADPDALHDYLESHPDAAARLSRMAADMQTAVTVAARAAVAACGVPPSAA
jgi:adenosylhomocysteine nucleosidase